MAIKVGGTEVISDSRALNNISSVDAATVTALSDAGVGAGATLEATASGTLANGDTVIVNADGTVSVVSGTTISTSVGSAGQYESGNATENQAVYDANAQKVVVAYRDVNNSGKATAVVGTVSGTSISFGSSVVILSSSSGSDIAVVYDSAAQKVVIAFKDLNLSSYGRAVVGTVSGTSISFGTVVNFRSGDTREISAAYDSNAGKVVIAFRDASLSFYGRAVVGTVSGTSISFGSVVTFQSASTDEPAVTYDSNAQKVVIGYVSTTAKAVVGTVSGTSISFGSPVEFLSNSLGNLGAVYDSAAQKVVFAFRDGTNDFGKTVVGTVSGTSISFGGAEEFHSAVTYYVSVTYDSNASKVVIVYSDSNNFTGFFRAGTVIGTSISFDTAVEFNADETTSMGSTYDSNAGKVVTTFRNEVSAVSTGRSVVIQVGYLDTNLAAENYIGISDGAYSDGNTATVQLVGSVDDAQTGLTAGSKYYVKTDGTLATTPDNPEVYAGLAVSSTNLIVKG